MRIGIPKELINHENRVAMTPAGVVTLTAAGHEVHIEKSAGEGSGFSDQAYSEVGARIVDTAEEAWAQELVLKVKAPIEEEFSFLREDLILFTYLHLANEKALTDHLLAKKTTSIAYETVQLPNRSLPLLTPMSEVAGRMSVQIGAQFLEKNYGGQGILLSGVPGVKRGKVTIIGGGIVGTNAAKIAIGFGAEVTIIDLNANRLRELEDIFGRQVTTLVSNPFNIGEAVKDSDLVVGAVLIPGAKAPKLVTEEMIKTMKPGAVVIDIAIDQGGVFETSDRVTTHDNPTYVKHDVVHYAVANMPGAVPRTSTIALTNATIPYALQIANKGFQQACQEDEALKQGLNTLKGHITHQGVAKAFQYNHVDANTLLS
ncbi:alanine dehydrogenase [Bacillus sp. SD088]|uniref:alanine dehydrogenase n=1 Tax=Bacillus sp. SD088 TaxID=2782012 RepID=UPI001A97BE9B|nr:alanine dehydrogenase [Bacillus sp. SD088]MBO0992334.1 alanine dehydrogenase [Bacillus sp. SD088]